MKEDTIVVRQVNHNSIESDLDVSHVIMKLSLDQITIDPNQPRKEVDEDYIKRLASDIESYGLHNPITVRPGEGRYIIVTGENRYRAFLFLKRASILCKLSNVIDPKTILLIQLSENLQRKDLNPIEEAKAYQILSEKYGLTHQEIAEKICRSREYVTNKLRLLLASPSSLELLKTEQLNESQVRALIPLPTDIQDQVTQEIIEKQLNTRQSERLIKTIQNVPRETSNQIRIKRLAIISLIIDQNGNLRDTIDRDSALTALADDIATLEEY